MKSIRDFDIENKKVIIRCDFNVPIKNGKIVDDTRITSALPTIEYALEHRAKVILLSHLGRIKEEKDKSSNTLEPVYKKLKKILDNNVYFSSVTRGKELEEKVEDLNSGEVLLVENTRYEDLNEKAESGNSDDLSSYWAGLGDIFINDAFGTIHRAHASNCGIAKHLPHGVGFLVEKELQALSEVDNPEKPFIVILGGAKVSDKIGVIEHIVKKCDYILIGGGMAFTFLKASGYEIGTSLYDEESFDFCQKMLKKYPEKIVLPVDFLTTSEYSNKTKTYKYNIGSIPSDQMGLDIGEETVKMFNKYLSSAKTVLWNGPLGVYEFSKYKKGTEKVLKHLVKENIKTILGGGDIVAASTVLGLKNKIYHVSTGGGATLEYLEGKTLPGVEALK